MTGAGGKNRKTANPSARESLLKQRLRQRAQVSGRGEAPAATASIPTEPVELSPYQRPLWVDYRMYPERRTAWIIRGYLLDGPVDTKRLADALSRLKERHWYLSCAIDSDGKVHPRDAEIPFEILTAIDDPWEDAQQYCRSRFEPFRLEQGQLFRVYVFAGRKRAAVVFAIHHILADHQSVDLLTTELSGLFDAGNVGIAPPEDLMQAYEQQQAKLEQDRPKLQQFWLDCFDQLASVKPLPLAKPGIGTVAREGGLIRIEADVGLAQQCSEAAAKAGVSAYQWFLAAWIVLLGRYYERNDIHVGTMFSTRSGTQQQNALGCFQNVLIVRANLELAVSFADVLSETRAVLGNAIAHGGLPLDDVARLTPVHRGRGQLFSTLFTLVDEHIQSQLLGRDVIRVEELDYAGTAFDLTFFVIASGENLSFAVEFDTAVYDRETLELVFDHYQALLADLAADTNSDWRRCSLTSPTKLESLRADWRRIAGTPRPTERLHDAFYRHAAAQPDAVALRWDDVDEAQQLSYGELAAQADSVAGLIESLTSDETMVAVIGAWGPDTVAALIGILRSGRTYLPIDADYPAARIEHILNDAGQPLVLLQQGIQAPDGFTGRCHSIADAISSTPVLSAPSVDNDVAYVIYTSGSSGAPKGVRVSHAAAVYSTAERSKVYAEWPPASFLLLSSFAFDSAVAGFWWGLSTGACIRLVDRKAVRAADTIAELICCEGITHTLCLPGQWSDICRVSKQPLESMKLVIVAGEACTAATIRHHFEHAPRAALYNEYGPTEMTVWSTFHPLEQVADDPVPIGRPLAMTQAIVVDANDNPVPDGLAGELLLAGHGIAEGYVGEASSGFVPHPLDPQGQAYRTGDRARVGSDGLLYYLGRMDEQVKFRGYRIGIESIEQAISSAGSEVAVVPWDGVSLEDLLAKLPEDQAHTLIDKFLSTEA